MSDTAKESTDARRGGGRGPKVGAVPDPGSTVAPDDDASGHGTTTCPVAWCPVCFAVTAVQPVKPEAVEHLLKAGAEFFLALRSLIDARADDIAGDAAGREGERELRKIDIG
jgi:hypothetical protein